MTDEEKHRLEVSERQLALVQSFFSRIDTKVSALFAITASQLAIAALNLTPLDLTIWYIAIPLAVFLIAATWVMVCLYLCTYPHLKGGSQSLIYFSEIAKRTESDYIKSYCGAPIKQLTEDMCGQIWRNSEIVSAKYRHLKHATVTAMLSLLPWVAYLIAVSLSHLRVPVIGH